MDILYFNGLWMTYNSVLALLAVIFGYYGFQKKLDFFRIILIFLWLLFLPNTVYVLTDITHFFDQYNKVATILLPFLALEYILLCSFGIFTYFVSMHMLENFLVHNKHVKNEHWSPFVIIVAINFLVGIAVMMGRIQRTNSWEVITNPLRVLVDLSYVLTTNEILFFIFPFWILTTALYYTLKRVALLKAK